jgi:hypothetical protein
LFFSLPRNPSPQDVGTMDHKFEISAVLMLNEGQEDSYVSHSPAVINPCR